MRVFGYLTTPADIDVVRWYDDEDMLTFLELFAQFGIPGLVIALQYLWIWRQERRCVVLNDELRAESSLRVEDAKGYTQLALELQGQVTRAVDKISTTLVVAANGQDHEH